MIVIKNGLVFDGTTAAPQKRDIKVRDDVIADLGNFANDREEVVIDAQGLYVAPGFVDISNRSDHYWTLFDAPLQESLIYQGVTTALMGNCGASLAPLAQPDTIKVIQKWTDVSNKNINWLTMKEFLGVLEQSKLGINIGTLVGHSTLRRGVMKDAARTITMQEISKMALMLEEGLESGAFGMSTGLAYAHARQADDSEIIALNKVVKKYNALFTSHLREEGEDLTGAVDEFIKIAAYSGVRGHISHFKAVGEENWRNFDAALALMDHMVQQGADISYDVYPYDTTASVLYTLLPNWVSDGGKEAMLKHLRDYETRKKIIAELRAGNNYRYDNIIVALSPRFFVGRSLSDIAKDQDIEPEEAMFDLILAGANRVIVFHKAISDKKILNGIINKLGSIGTNGAGYNLSFKKLPALAHPRSFGSFPRVLAEYVRKEQVITWENALYKMTLMNAQKIGLKNRGKIDKNYFADMVIFDPQKIADKANFTDPYQYAEGMRYVIINGKIALSEGKIADDVFAGRVLRRA